MSENFGWQGNLHDFLETENEIILDSLQNYERKEFDMEPNSLQISAWRNSIDILKDQIKKLNSLRNDLEYWSIIFEYELPREGGRRPDVILLKNDTVLVLEFKDFENIHISHVDQVLAYARDIRTYHEMSHDLVVIPILIPTKWKEKSKIKNDVHIINIQDIATKLSDLGGTSSKEFDPTAWINSEYSPLPSIVQAARIIFAKEEFPRIKRAHSAGIPQTIDELISIADYAKEQNTNQLALVTGVPGSGKTLVGLQFVYGIHNFEEFDKIHSVFLSGNGPLVEVLRHALGKGSSAFVQPVHNFLKEYGGNSQKSPKENIWIYDEAQRAWDAQRVLEKRGHNNSEPDDFVQISDKIPTSTMIIGLIGEGQNIHLGEEGGIQLWSNALQKSKKQWHVHCPDKLKKYFSDSKVTTSEKLDLTITLRSHIAEDADKWVSLLLDSQIENAKKISEKIKKDGFEIYITRNLEDAKTYVKERYQHQNEKRYGLIASSKAKILPKYGILNDFFVTRRLKNGPWFNDSPDSIQSCCQLKDVCTEFACQGLELDFPIVCWGEDLLWKNQNWISKKTRSSAKDPHSLRVNSYRVLLSRGRDGIVIFLPSESELDTTFDVLKNSGCQELIL